MDTQTAPYPPGIALVAPDSVKRKVKQAIETHEEVTKDLAKVGRLKLFFKMSEAGELVKIIAKRAKAMIRVDELAKEFRMVNLDTTIKRKVEVENRWLGSMRNISVPFIFSAKLPAKTKTSYVVVIPAREPREPRPRFASNGRRLRRHRWNPNSGRPERYTVSSITPRPPDAALEVLQKHADKFDHTEVWWVPKDLVIKEVRERSADPIVVGVIEAPRKGKDAERFCFELYRWEQPDLEKPYFAHEAY
jgi:hypothetical protein